MQKTKRKKNNCQSTENWPETESRLYEKRCNVLIWSQDLGVLSTYFYFISFAFKWNQNRMFGNYYGKDQIESASGKFDSQNDFNVNWIRVIHRVYKPVHCYWMCSTNCENSISQKEKKRTTKHDSVNVLWKSICFFLLLLSKIDFVSFKVQWNAWFSL